MARTKHGTLVPNEVTVATISAGPSGVVVVNRSQSGVIWTRLDGQDPEVDGDDTFAVLGAREFIWSYSRQGEPFEVRMMAGSALEYSVEAF